MSRALSKTFWLLCSMEMWERLAYYGMRVVVPIYIAQADEPGGLHFTQMEKGNIYAWWFVFQSVLPTFTGGYADRYGYKKTMAVAISLNAIGYVIMAYGRDFWSFFFGVMVLATGTAFFKPSIQGSLAQNLTKDISSLGWGIFYWIVNVGAAIGPPLAKFIRTDFGWQALFFTAAGDDLLGQFVRHRSVVAHLHRKRRHALADPRRNRVNSNQPCNRDSRKSGACTGGGQKRRL